MLLEGGGAPPSQYSVCSAEILCWVHFHSVLHLLTTPELGSCIWYAMVLYVMAMAHGNGSQCWVSNQYLYLSRFVVEFTKKSISYYTNLASNIFRWFYIKKTAIRMFYQHNKSNLVQSSYVISIVIKLLRKHRKYVSIYLRKQKSSERL